MFAFIKRWTKTEHEFCQEELSAFLDGQLSQRERQRVERHLKKCSACQRDLVSLQQTVALLRSTPVLKPPRSFFIPVSERAKQKQAQRTRLVYGYLRAATAVATVLLVLVISSDAVLRFATVTSARPMLGATPEARTWQAEPTAMEQVKVLSAPSLAPLPPPEGPTAVPLTMGEAAPQQAPEPIASTEPELLLFAGEPTSVATAEPVVDGQMLEAKALPSQTFARSAGPPPLPAASPEEVPIDSPTAKTTQPSPTTVLVAEAVSTVEPESTETSILPIAELVPSETAVPPTVEPEPTQTPVPPAVESEPTQTPVPPTVEPEPTETPITPTATPLPTETPVLPTATPVPTQVPIAAVGLPSPQPITGEGQASEIPLARPGLWTLLMAMRPLLPWLEWTLGVMAVLLLVITLWLRQAQRSL
nr:zf-HC2 domain-containing protein [Chloroflexota bacterium]